MDKDAPSMTSPLIARETSMTDDLTYADETKTLFFENRAVMLYLNSTHLLVHDVKNIKKNVDLVLEDILGSEVVVRQKKKIETYILKIHTFASLPAGCCSGKHKRTLKTFSVLFEDNLTCKNWENAINCSIQKIRLSYVADEEIHRVLAPPKRKFKVIVNPFSGKGTALKIWRLVTEPMLKLAGIEIDLLITERQNHAYEIMSKCDLSDVDVILTVGGDGILFEVINGLYTRDDVRNSTNPVPVFPIPGGTGNGLTKSILHECDEDFSPENATYVALKGTPVPFDLSYVETANYKHYAFLILGWGLISDVDILSESMRWMGEPRMTVAAVYFVLARRLYPGRLSMFTGVNSSSQSSMPRLCSIDEILGRTTTADENSILPPLGVPINGGEGWTVIEGDFVLVWVLQTSHCSVSVHSGPGITLDDGMFTIIVARDLSRFEMMQLLLAVEDGSHVKHPKVEVYKASSYRLEPLTDKGIFSLDGEVVEYGPIQASILPSVARTISMKPYIK